MCTENSVVGEALFFTQISRPPLP